MVGSLTVGKKKYAAVEADLRALNARAKVLRRRLEALVQADAEAFLPLAAAYGLPKETPEQQAHKAAVLEQALDGACAVPLEIMEACCEGIALAQEYAAKGSALAVSLSLIHISSFTLPSPAISSSCPKSLSATLESRATPSGSSNRY